MWSSDSSTVKREFPRGSCFSGLGTKVVISNSFTGRREVLGDLAGAFGTICSQIAAYDWEIEVGLTIDGLVKGFGLFCVDLLVEERDFYLYNENKNK